MRNLKLGTRAAIGKEQDTYKHIPIQCLRKPKYDIAGIRYSLSVSGGA